MFIFRIFMMATIVTPPFLRVMRSIRIKYTMPLFLKHLNTELLTANTTINKVKTMISKQSVYETQQGGVVCTKFHYCYFLRSQNLTYNGYTVDLKRRLRQHNREIKGGAKYTSRKKVVSPWRYDCNILLSNYVFQIYLQLHCNISLPTLE